MWFRLADNCAFDTRIWKTIPLVNHVDTSQCAASLGDVVIEALRRAEEEREKTIDPSKTLPPGPKTMSKASPMPGMIGIASKEALITLTDVLFSAVIFPPSAISEVELLQLWETLADMFCQTLAHGFEAFKCRTAGDFVAYYDDEFWCALHK